MGDVYEVLAFVALWSIDCGIVCGIVCGMVCGLVCGMVCRVVVWFVNQRSAQFHVCFDGC